MNTLSYTSLSDKIQTYGRTWYDREEQVLYSNYTCGGFRFRFTGSFLAVRFRAIPDTFVPPNVTPPAGAPPREDWPYMAVFLDDDRTPCRKQAVRDGETVPVFFSETVQTHEVRLIKLTENFRTALGLAGIVTDGEILPLAPEKRDVIEFIGDSITCGFGNAATDPAHEFEAAEEDGWMTYGAITARNLGLEPRFISVSGISIENPVPMPGFYCMRDLYPYADRIIQEKLAIRRSQPVPLADPYNFAEKPARYIVLNLGTNDANQIYFRTDKAQALADFRKNYRTFLEEIRSLNGPDPVILCALGCMDYYLFDEIRDIVDQYRTQSGDHRVDILKFNKMMNVGADVGGCLHPSIHRHKLMAEDLTAKIRRLQEAGL